MTDGRQQHAPDAVLGIWQEVVGAVLAPASAMRFKAHPDQRALCRYSEDRLRTAGSALHERSGRLLLSEWARECAWDGGGSVALDWAQLASNDPDAVAVARDLFAAALGSIRYERDRNVLVQRLGLDGDAPMTLQEIGEDLHLSRERIRQIQERTVDRMCRRRIPPSASNYVGQVIAEIISQAAESAVEPAVAFLTLAEAACPSVPTGSAVQLLARLAGQGKNASKHLNAEVRTLLTVRQAELNRERSQTRSAEQAAARLNRMLPNVVWPGERAEAPPRSTIQPQRETEAEKAGTWQSAKLAREVSYDSVAELSLIRLLDRAPQIEWFCEQPVAIGYTFGGRHRTYYPDLLVATNERHCVLIEVKPLPEMALAINQAKAAAARAFCARCGWGYLLTDHAGRTPDDLLAVPVPEQAARAFAEALHAAGTMTWPSVKAQRDRHGLTSLQVNALALQRGWDIQLGPYRLRAA